jgi:hypothetical protein
MRLRYSATSFFLILVLIALPLHARVIRVEVASRADVLEGKAFGDTGAYERITGRVYFSLPLANPHNLPIVDLRNAVNLKNGEVEFSSDFIAIRPKDVHKGNGSFFLEIPNRGRARILALVDGGDSVLANNAGDAWLLRKGFSIVSLGWQWDAEGPGALRFFAPAAKENGRTITGLLRGDLMPSKVMPEIPLGHLILGNIGGIEYPVSAPDDPRNVLTVRDSPNGQRTVIPTLSGCLRTPSMAKLSQPAYSPEQRLPAREDLRICLRGPRSHSSWRRLCRNSRLCLVRQARSRCYHSSRAC